MDRYQILCTETSRKNFRELRAHYCTMGQLAQHTLPKEYNETLFLNLLECYGLTPNRSNPEYYHSLNSERLYWLWKWLGLEYLDVEEDMEVYSFLLDHLKELWTSSNFHPFVTIDQAKTILQKSFVSEDKNILVLRLSSTKPGGISVTCLNDQGQFKHWRFLIQGKTSLLSVERIKEYYKSLSDFASYKMLIYEPKFIKEV